MVLGKVCEVLLRETDLNCVRKLFVWLEENVIVRLVMLNWNVNLYNCGHKMHLSNMLLFGLFRIHSIFFNIVIKQQNIVNIEYSSFRLINLMDHQNRKKLLL